MYPSLYLLGKTVPTYWLCALAGGATCFFVARIRHKHFQELQKVDITNSAALVLIGVLIGARLLYLISITSLLAKNYYYLIEHPKIAYDILANGMVFYGGLFGAILTLHFYIKAYNLDGVSFFDFYTPLFPLFHSFGRVGCFLTGCCHGIESKKYGIAFSHSTSSANGIPYFPVQLLCSIGNLFLFFILLNYEKKTHRQGKTLPLYLFLYSVARFIIEFLRGDTIRGIWGGLSMSQWLSILILISLAIYYKKGLQKLYGKFRSFSKKQRNF